MPEITPRHIAVLALLEAEPPIQADEVARRLGVPVIDVEVLCRDLAAAGLFGADASTD